MPKQLKNKKYLLFIAALAAIFLLGQPVLSYAQYDGNGFLSRGAGGNLLQTVAFRAVLDDRAEKAGHDGLLDVSAIRDFYASRNNTPFWTAGLGSTDRAREVAKLLQNSWMEGLNPETYHAAEITGLLNSSMLFMPQKARLEALLTDAVMRYGRDMSGMRVDPAAIRQKAEFWRTPMTPAQVMQKVTEERRPVRALEDLSPQTPLYKALREELIRLTEEQKEDRKAGHDDAPVQITLGGAYIFSPGQKNKDIPILRERIGVKYDPAAGPETLYDPALVKAVIAYQKVHSLDDDGRIGSKTLALLNRSRQDKIDQIVANMERLRWLDPQMPERYIMVNIPSQRLWGYDHGKAAIEIPVIVGMPQRQTRDFSTTITGVRFNPTWTVPMGIKVADMLPKLQQDVRALVEEKKLNFYNGLSRNAEQLDPEDINWDNMTRAELSRIQMVQPAGDHNALGRIRVIMPNEFDIYLHDTNHPDLFAKNDRTLSSGCVRLSDPKKVAQFILSNNKNWTKSKMTDLIAAGNTVDVPVDQTMPVYIVYQSIWLDQKGKLVYGADVYKRDRKLVDTLIEADAVFRPDDPGEGSRLAMAR